MSRVNPNGTHVMPRRVRWIVGGAVVSLLVIGGVVWRSREVANSRQARAAATGTDATANAMADMPGMAMPPGAPTSGAAGGTTVRLSADQMRQFGVTFGVVERRELTNEARAPGIVTADSSRIVQVAPRVGGYVERLYANASGQPVRRGQPLMDVYSPELVAAEQELLVAVTLQRSVGRSDVPGVPAGGPDLVAAARQRLALWGVSDAQIADILRTGRARRTLTLFAPASGVVLDKNVVQGQALQPGQMLYTIADLTNVWVDTQLREMDAATVKPGALATVAASGLPGRPLTGRVTYVYPTLDPQARTVRARVNVANAAGLLRPGMYATVTLSSPSRTALTAPASAILRTGERNVVFVDMGKGELMPHDVELGRTAGDHTEILSGLEPGQRVATSAQFLLDAESNLGDVMRSMIGQGNAGSAGSTPAMGDMPGMDTNANMHDKGADLRGMSTTPPASASPPASPRNPRRQ